MAEQRFEDFVGLIDALHKEIQRIKASEAERLGFKGADVMCLYYLTEHEGGLTASELARMADVSRAAMSRTVARLEEGGLVEVGASEDAASKYRAPVRLTARGKEAVAPMSAIVADVLSETGRVLGEAERAQMYESLNLILDRLRKFSR